MEEAKKYLEKLEIEVMQGLVVLNGDGVWKHVNLSKLLTDFANSNDKIKVAEDGVTVLDEPKEWDKWLKLALPLNEWSQDDSEYLIYQKAESITIQEHNKRLISEIKRNKSLHVLDNDMSSKHAISVGDQLKEANETITTYKKAIKVAGYLFNGRFYKSLDELKGKTMSKENQPKPLYF